MELSNAATIEDLGDVEVAYLPQAASLTPQAIAAVSGSLDAEAWISQR
jgi:hypothetical protein